MSLGRYTSPVPIGILLYKIRRKLIFPVLERRVKFWVTECVVVLIFEYYNHGSNSGNPIQCSNSNAAASVINSKLATIASTFTVLRQKWHIQIGQFQMTDRQLVKSLIFSKYSLYSLRLSTNTVKINGYVGLMLLIYIFLFKDFFFQ